jgi:N-acetylglucosamine kinase-like BadF-type ATPase
MGNDGTQARFAIDAGGSRTVLELQRPDGTTYRAERPSCAIATVGATRAAEILDELLTRLSDEVGSATPALGCIASSAMPFLNEADPPRVLLDVITRVRLRGCVALVNDLVPMIWSDHVAGNGLIVSSGTGSSVVGRTAAGRLLKVGGHEYVISDEGSAYSLGLRALQAATRAADGTGPATALTAAAADLYAEALPALGRRLAESADRRCVIAKLAPRVVAAYEAGDSQAVVIVTTEAAALARSASAAVERLGFGPGVHVGLVGGVMRGSKLFRDLVVEAMSRSGLTPITAVLDNVQSVVQFVDLIGGDEGAALVRSVGGLAIHLADVD